MLITNFPYLGIGENQWLVCLYKVSALGPNLLIFSDHDEMKELFS